MIRMFTREEGSKKFFNDDSVWEKIPIGCVTY